jgi:hypothetical protein
VPGVNYVGSRVSPLPVLDETFSNLCLGIGFMPLLIYVDLLAGESRALTSIVHRFDLCLEVLDLEGLPIVAGS